jgi:hypothetical protein
MPCQATFKSSSTVTFHARILLHMETQVVQYVQFTLFQYLPKYERATFLEIYLQQPSSDSSYLGTGWIYSTVIGSVSVVSLYL